MIRRDEVEKIAVLANLDLTEEEIETMRLELSRILEFVEELNALHLPDLPTERLQEETDLPLREDREVPFPADDLIDQAPSLNRRYYEVPIVIGEDDSSEP